MTWAVPAKSQSKTEKPRLSIEAQCFNRYIPTCIDKQTDQLLNKNVTIPLLFTIHYPTIKKKRNHENRAKIYFKYRKIYL